MMRVHVLGICGTFMGGLALLAREAGFEVSGSDSNVYPPMSTQLAEQGIDLHEGYTDAVLNDADLVVVGNAMSRGNVAVEAMLNRGLHYISGPQWLGEQVVKDRWVLAVAGTHGKTSTASMLAWLLEAAGLEPGFLIGGIPANFGLSARFGKSPFFVVEADEYDTAFFDKRSKFVHYHPRTLILNNLEYDHADIFPDIAAIKTQFHHLLRTVPGQGLVISNAEDTQLAQVLDRGCWTPVETFAGTHPDGQWQAANVSDDGSVFDVVLAGVKQGQVKWSQLGQHNVNNALAAIAAARHAGVPVAQSIEALADFKGVKRRMEVRGVIRGVTVYDDFAHHPTAIQTTLAGLRGRVGRARIIAVLEPRSNTMRMGVHEASLPASLAQADFVLCYQADTVDWDLRDVMTHSAAPAQVFNAIESLVSAIVKLAESGDHILVMSNGGFGGIHDKLLAALAHV